MKLIVTYFFPVSSYFHLGLNILVGILFSNSLSLCSSLNIRDEIFTLRQKSGQNCSYFTCLNPLIVALGGLVVSVLATGPKVRGFNPGRGEVKPAVPCRRFTANRDVS